MWVRPESGRSAHAWQPGDYEPSLSGSVLSWASPQKKSPMPGEMGARVALEGGGSVAELERDGEGNRKGENYIYGVSPTVASLLRLLLLRLRFLLFVSLCSALPEQCSLSLFNQPPVVFHLARAPLEPTNHHRIPCSEPRA